MASVLLAFGQHIQTTQKFVITMVIIILIQKHKNDDSLIQIVEYVAQKKKMELKLTFEFVLACKRGREKKLIKI